MHSANDFFKNVTSSDSWCSDRKQVSHFLNDDNSVWLAGWQETSTSFESEMSQLYGTKEIQQWLSWEQIIVMKDNNQLVERRLFSFHGG